MKLRLFNTISTLLLAIAIALAACNPAPIVVMPPDDTQQLGVTHFTGLSVSGSETDALVVNQTSTGDIVELRDNGTVVWRLADGGLQSFEGSCLDLDADDDTSICADTDDQIDVELGGSDTVILKRFPAATTVTATTNIQEIAGSVPAWTSGTNVLNAIDVDLAIGDVNTGTHTIRGIMIDGITQDAQATEVALYIENGWDRGIELDGNSLYVDNDNDSYFSELADDSIGFTPGAATGSLEIRTGNLQVGDGTPDQTHNGEDLYVEGISEFDGHAYFDNAITVTGNISATGSVTVVGTLSVTSDVSLGGILTGGSNQENMYLPTVASTAFTYTASEGGTVALFTVADGEIWLVHRVYLHVTTNFDCTGDDCVATIGDGNDVDGFLVFVDAELQTTDTECTGAPAGWQGFCSTDTIGAYLSEGLGFIYAPSGAAETIDVVLSAAGNDFSAGAATAYVIYTRIQ